MNKIFKVIFNRNTHQFVVVSELGKNKTQNKSQRSCCKNSSITFFKNLFLGISVLAFSIHTALAASNNTEYMPKNPGKVSVVPTAPKKFTLDDLKPDFVIDFDKHKVYKGLIVDLTRGIYLPHYKDKDGVQWTYAAALEPDKFYSPLSPQVAEDYFIAQGSVAAGGNVGENGVDNVIRNTAVATGLSSIAVGDTSVAGIKYLTRSQLTSQFVPDWNGQLVYPGLIKNIANGSLLPYYLDDAGNYWTYASNIQPNTEYLLVEGFANYGPASIPVAQLPAQLKPANGQPYPNPYPMPVNQYSPYGYQAIAIGKNATAGNRWDLTIGTNSLAPWRRRADSETTYAFTYYKTDVTGQHVQKTNIPIAGFGERTALGHYAASYAMRGIAIGTEAKTGLPGAPGSSGVLPSPIPGVGFIYGVDSIALGSYATSIGHLASMAIGPGSFADKSANFGLAIGTGAMVSPQGGVALGSFSVADRPGIPVDWTNAKIGDRPASKISVLNGDITQNIDPMKGQVFGLGSLADMQAIQHTAEYTRGAISVGGVGQATTGDNPKDPNTDKYHKWLGTAYGPEEEYTRQITHVAAGSTNTDAVNVAQLRGVAAVIPTYIHVNTNNPEQPSGLNPEYGGSPDANKTNHGMGNVKAGAVNPYDVTVGVNAITLANTAAKTTTALIPDKPWTRYTNAAGETIPMANVGQAVSIGHNSTAAGPSAVAMGASAWAQTEGVAIGIGTKSDGIASLSIGAGAKVNLDNTKNSTDYEGVAIGHNATVNNKAGIALGASALVNTTAGVAIGSGSNADTAGGIKGFDPLSLKGEKPTKVDENAFLSTANVGAVSVGGKSGTNTVYRQITNVAAGTKDTDAVNVAQLKDLIVLGLNVFGNANQPGTTSNGQYLGSSVKIVGAPATGDLNKDYSTQNLTTVYSQDAQGTGTVTVEMKEQPQFKQVTVGDGTTKPDTVISPKGVTITPDTKTDPKAQPVSITSGGLDNGGNQIKNVASGIPDGKTLDNAPNTNGANIGDVKKAMGDLTDEGLKFGANSGKAVTNKLGSEIDVKGAGTQADTNYSGENIKTKVSQKDGTTTIDIMLAKDLNNLTGVHIADGPSMTKGGINAGNKVITNVAPGKITPDSKDAVNGSQIDSLGKTLGLAPNKAGTGFDAPKFTPIIQPNGKAGTAPTDYKNAIGNITDALNKGFIINGNAFGQGTKDGQQYLGSTLKIIGKKATSGVTYSADNLTTVYTKDAQGNGTVLIEMKEQPQFKQVTVGDGTAKPDTVISPKGVTITPDTKTDPKAQPVSITSGGLDNGGNQIKNVASGIPEGKTLDNAPNTNGANIGDVKKALSPLQNNTITLSGNTGSTTAEKLDQKGGLNFKISGDGDITTSASDNDVTIKLNKETKAKIDNAADKNLSNITPAGKKVITGLGTIVAQGDNVTVTDNADKTTGQHTYTVSVNPTGKVEDGNTGIVTGGTVDKALTPIKTAVKTNTTNITDLQNNTITLSGNTGDTTAEKLDQKGGLNFKISGDGDITTSASGNDVTIKLNKETKAKIDNAADKNLSNITPEGKKVITGLGTIVAQGDNVTVTDNADKTTGQHTYTVSVNPTGKVEDGNTGIVTGGTVDKALTPIKTAVKTNTTNITDLQNNTITLSGNTGDTTAEKLDQKGGLNFKISGDGDITTSASGNDVTIKLNKETKAKIDNAADKNLSNITPEGKKVITGLGTIVAQGDNVTVTDNADKTTGQHTYTVSVNKDLKGLDGVHITNGPSMTKGGIDAGNKVITNVAAGKITPDSKDAVNGSQIDSLGKTLGLAPNKAGTDFDAPKFTPIIQPNGKAGTAPTDYKNAIGNITNALNKGFIINANHNVDSGQQYLGSVLAIIGQKAASGVSYSADNLTTVYTKDAKGNGTVLIEMKEQPQFKQVTVGDGTNKPDTVISPKGVTITPDTKTDPKAQPVSITSGGLDNGGNQIKNVASGIPDGKTLNDAPNTNGANIGDVKKAMGDLTDEGLKFGANSGKAVTNKLGSEIDVKGAGTQADTNYSGENIKTKVSQKDGTTTIDIMLAKDLNNLTGVHIADGPSMTKGGINAGNKVITNVAPGKITPDSKDAVNGSQIDSLGKTLGLAPNKAGTGFDAPKFTPIIQPNGKAGTAPTDYKNAIGNITDALNKGFIINGNAFGQGTKDGQQYLGSTLKIIGKKATSGVTYSADNLTTVYTKDAQGNGTVLIEMKEQPQFKQVTVGDGTAKPDTVISPKGVTITPDTKTDPKAQPVSITSGGLDNGGNQIKNVASGLGGESIDKASGNTLKNGATIGDIKKAMQQVNAIDDKGLSFGADKAATAGGKNPVTNKLGSEVDIHGDNENITTTVSQTDKDGIKTDIQVKLNSKITVKSVTGLDNGSLKAGSKDAVNGGQIHSLSQVLGISPTANNSGFDAPKFHKIYDINGKPQPEYHNFTDTINHIIGTLNKGLIINANRNINDGQQYLGSTLAILGAAEVGKADDYSSTNITTVYSQTQGNGTVKIMMKDKPDFKQINVGNGANGTKTTINPDGVTITPAGSGSKPVSITSKGLDNGGNQIHNVADGTAKNDAVNKGQLDNVVNKAIDNSTTALTDKGLKFNGNEGGPVTNKLGSEVDIKGAGIKEDSAYSGENIKTKVSQKDGNTTIDIMLANDLENLTGVHIKDGPSMTQSGINAGGKVITNVGETYRDLHAAATVGQLKKLYLDIKHGEALPAKGLDFSADTGGYVNNPLGSTVEVLGDGSNIQTHIEKTPDDKTKININLSDHIHVKQITVQNEPNQGSTTINDQGVTVKSANGKSVSVTDKGLDNGGNVISNVAAGTAPTDAVNVKQLNVLANEVNKLKNGMQGNVGKALADMRHQIKKNRKESNAGSAAAIAAANLPQPFLAGRSIVGAAIGSYRNQQAVSIGASRISDNGKWIIRSSITQDTQHNFGAGMGFGYQW